MRIRNAEKGAGQRLPYRRVPICPQLRHAIECRHGQPAEPLLQGRQHNWRRDFIADCRKAGIEGFTRIHDLRDTFASWLAQSGRVTLLELRDLMGHATTMMTERYAHLMPDAGQAAAEALGEIAPKTAQIEQVSGSHVAGT